MSFDDLDDLLDDTLRLPIGGKVYAVPNPPGEVGLRVIRLMRLATRYAVLVRKQTRLAELEAQGQQPTGAERITPADRLKDSELDELQMDDEQERVWYGELLGPVFDQLLADGVSIAKVKHVATTVQLWVSRDLSAAEAYWASAKSRPEAAAPEESSLPAPGAAASTSPSTTSGSGTRTPRSRPAKKAKSARGTTSPSTGT